METEERWTEWHLTPRGWDRGRWRIGDKADMNVPAPADRVMTCELTDFNNFRETWRCERHSAALDLVIRFGALPPEAVKQLNVREWLPPKPDGAAP